MMDIVYEPKFWISVAFILCMAAAYKKGAPLLLSALDSRTQRIRSELDQARALREEAQAVLADYQRKQAEYLKEAQAMLDKARRDADALAAQAEKDLAAAMETRTHHAMERIAREEEKLIREVRDHVVDIALASARAALVKQMGQLPPEELARLALSDIERKVH